MDKLEGNNLDLKKIKLEELKKLFPELFNEGKLDFNRLKTYFGEEIIDNAYQLTWNGKTEAIKFAQTPNYCTLRPIDDKVCNSNNIYIEGDNAEVLKTLLKTYNNKIDVIYIDPPYNTGSDFVYKDNYSINNSDFKEINNYNFRANPTTNGRYHTDWLNMMYPRLVMAKELLSKHGIIFISIDENESFNLRYICEEIFGKDNFVTEMVWKSRTSLQYTEPLISSQTEYIQVYVKDKDVWNLQALDLENLDGDKELLGFYTTRIKKPLDSTNYSNPDNDPRGPWLSSGKVRNDGRPSYTVTSPTGVQHTKPWIYSPEVFKKLDEAGLIYWGLDGSAQPRKKSYLKDFKGNVSSNLLEDEFMIKIKDNGTYEKKKLWTIGTTESGSKELKELIGLDDFDYPKPVSLIKYLVNLHPNKNCTVLDFFSGSGTTGQAVLELNNEDQGHRNFILVQLPVALDEKKSAYAKGFRTICDIAQLRLNKYIENNMASNDLFNTNFNENASIYSIFRLDTTNIKPWDGNVEYNSTSLWDLDETIKEGRTNLDVAYEIMLKYGVFNMQLKEITVNNKIIYSVGEGYLLISLNDDITEQDYIEIGKLQPQCVVFKESGFADDNVKMNATYTLERLGVKDVKCI